MAVSLTALPVFALPHRTGVMIETFESGQVWGNDDRMNATLLSIDDTEITALESSRNYLSIHFQKKASFRIFPEKKIFCSGYPESFAFYVYGQGNGEEIYIDMENNQLRFFRIFAVRIGWRGWRKIEVEIPARIKRRGTKLQDASGLYFLGFYIKGSGTDSRILLDDISVTTRPYLLPYSGGL